jgi:transposase-like protein
VVGVWRGLVARSLSRMQLIIADAHAGLVAAIGFALPGAPWQRTHYLRNLLTKVPKSAQPMWSPVRTISDQADAQAAHTHFDRVVAALAENPLKLHRTAHDNRNTDRLKYRNDHTEPSHTPALRTWSRTAAGT